MRPAKPSTKFLHMGLWGLEAKESLNVLMLKPEVGTKTLDGQSTLLLAPLSIKNELLLLSIQTKLLEKPLSSYCHLFRIARSRPPRASTSQTLSDILSTLPVYLCVFQY